MELSRQTAINRMVENNMGVGIAGAKFVAAEFDGKNFLGNSKAQKSNGIQVWHDCAAGIIHRSPK